MENNICNLAPFLFAICVFYFSVYTWFSPVFYSFRRSLGHCTNCTGQLNHRRSRQQQIALWGIFLVFTNQNQWHVRIPHSRGATTNLSVPIDCLHSESFVGNPVELNRPRNTFIPTRVTVFQNSDTLMYGLKYKEQIREGIENVTIVICHRPPSSAWC